MCTAVQINTVRVSIFFFLFLLSLFSYSHRRSSFFLQKCWKKSSVLMTSFQTLLKVFSFIECIINPNHPGSNLAFRNKRLLCNLAIFECIEPKIRRPDKHPRLNGKKRKELQITLSWGSWCRNVTCLKLLVGLKIRNGVFWIIRNVQYLLVCPAGKVITVQQHTQWHTNLWVVYTGIYGWFCLEMTSLVVSLSRK